MSAGMRARNAGDIEKSIAVPQPNKSSSHLPQGITPEHMQGAYSIFPFSSTITHCQFDIVKKVRTSRQIFLKMRKLRQ